MHGVLKVQIRIYPTIPGQWDKVSRPVTVTLGRILCEDGDAEAVFQTWKEANKETTKIAEFFGEWEADKLTFH